MRLYHFTDKNLLESIMKEGLTKGHMCLGEKTPNHFVLLKNIQWLTDINTIKHTSLEKSYRKARLIVDIPDGDEKLLSPRLWKKKYLKQVFNGYKGAYTSSDNNHYWIYDGIIPPQWITIDKIEE